MCPNNDILSAYSDNELEGKVKLVVENHISNCNCCLQKVNTFKMLANALEDSTSDKMYEDSFKRVSNSVESLIIKKRVNVNNKRKYIVPSIGFASISLILIFAFTFFTIWGYNVSNPSVDQVAVEEETNLEETEPEITLSSPNWDNIKSVDF